ncbi:MAG TPA: response regulator [Rhodocyclaceae bacterium]|nr:response regulator [Rhodocyclaceae bacterium]
MPTPDSPAYVHVVDDDASLRRALTFLLESVGWCVIGHGSAEEFMTRFDRGRRPACLVLDIRMPMMSGLELQQLLSDRGIRVPIVFLTGPGDVAMAVQAMKFGAADFIEKPFKDQVLLDAIGRALRRDSEQRMEKRERQALLDRLNRLSPREIEVARLVAEGLPSKTISQRLDISERTVQVHRLHLMGKLEVHSVAELAKLIWLCDGAESGE